MLVGAVVVTSMVVASESAQQAKLGCQDSCYDLTIPYPFGSTESCYYDRNFLITCNKTLAKPFLWRGNLEVRYIGDRGSGACPAINRL